jgi:hypothetical protein
MKRKRRANNTHSAATKKPGSDKNDYGVRFLEKGHGLGAFFKESDPLEVVSRSDPASFGKSGC